MDFLKNLFGHREAEAANNQVYGNENPTAEHKSSWTHEIIAGAAGFEAMKAYENHLARTGETPSHSRMKELLAAFAAAEVDKLIETKGLDEIDAEKAKRQAVEQAKHLAAERYNGGTGPDQ